MVSTALSVPVASPHGQVVAGGPSSMPRFRQQPSRTESDREMLVRRMAAGDHAAMAEFYDGTSALVFGLALRIAAEHSAAQDILVEVYAQAWKQAPEFDAARGSALTWLLTMTR